MPPTYGSFAKHTRKFYYLSKPRLFIVTNQITSLSLGCQPLAMMNPSYWQPRCRAAACAAIDMIDFRAEQGTRKASIGARERRSVTTSAPGNGPGRRNQR